MKTTTRKPNLFAALMALTCGGLAITFALAGVINVACMFSTAAMVWSWNL